ncbi:MAG: hypothetical protein V1244_02165 [Nitrospinaceae bacterium]|nr:hypothetical protein [Nitrospinaceae bacterium]
MSTITDWVFPAGLGMLGVLLVFLKWNAQTAPAKVTKLQRHH